jgi:hypothetical protein
MRSLAPPPRHLHCCRRMPLTPPQPYKRSFTRGLYGPRIKECRRRAGQVALLVLFRHSILLYGVLAMRCRALSEAAGSTFSRNYTASSIFRPSASASEIGSNVSSMTKPVARSFSNCLDNTCCACDEESISTRIARAPHCRIASCNSAIACAICFFVNGNSAWERCGEGRDSLWRSRTAL